ncbi:MAG TPA: TlpA disulfide reductase family protein [Pirellulaceae bacterium]|nr:TlpA disulfide reductase family protein [Pirellulaceae bacterium]
MSTLIVILNGVLLLALLVLGFLVLGTLRALGVVNWRIDQLQATTPSRIGRDGLRIGKQAPDFTLPGQERHDVSLHEFQGRKVLLVFTQAGCGPCHDIVPELNRLHDRGECQVVGINNGELGEAAIFAAETGARFPVLAQEKFSLSKRYQVFATPFAFFIDEQGVIRSKGTVAMRQHLGYVLSGIGQTGQVHGGDAEPEASPRPLSADTMSPLANSLETTLA